MSYQPEARKRGGNRVSNFQELWEDKDVRFDASQHDLQLRIGEKVIASVEEVEDVKGNPNEKGMLILTSLRVLWVMLRKPRINLSIGLGAIMSCEFKKVSTRLGTSHTMLLNSTSGPTRFQFLFSTAAKVAPEEFELTQRCVNAYAATYLYRDLKLRGNLVVGPKLVLLPEEQVYTVRQGVWNLAQEQGTLGVVYATNFRFVWHSQVHAQFNVSMPHFQILTISLRESKYGPALVVKTAQRAGSYTLGFQMESPDEMHKLLQELQSVWQIYSEKPSYGVDIALRVEGLDGRGDRGQEVLNSIQIVDDGSLTDPLLVYMTGGDGEGRRPVYSASLGLAIEEPPQDATVEHLWAVAF